MGVANLLHGERRVVDRVLELTERSELLLDVGAERNALLSSGRHFDAPDPAAVEHDHCRTIAKKTTAGHEVARPSRFLIVALHVLQEPAFIARFEIANAQVG